MLCVMGMFVAAIPVGLFIVAVAVSMIWHDMNDPLSGQMMD
jgi:hypothetical protein